MDERTTAEYYRAELIALTERAANNPMDVDVRSRLEFVRTAVADGLTNAVENFLN